VVITWWKELFRWFSTTTILVLNMAQQKPEPWRSPRPRVEPTEADTHLGCVEHRRVGRHFYAVQVEQGRDEATPEFGLNNQ
jgi:hypothetical protein